MGEFTLDTSGEVLAQRASSGGPFAFHWSDLDAFTQGYVEALFAALGYGDTPERAEARAHHGRGWVCNFSGGHCPSGCGSPCSYSTDRTHMGGGVEVRDYNRLPGFSDLAPEALAAILKDCREYQADVHGTYTADHQRRAGSMFWRCRQGMVSWAGGCNESDRFPPLTASLGDDGKVYLRGAV